MKGINCGNYVAQFNVEIFDLFHELLYPARKKLSSKNSGYKPARPGPATFIHVLGSNSGRGRKIMIFVAFFFRILPKIHFYSILNLILRFTKEEAEVRKQAFPFVPARYIRILTFYQGCGEFSISAFN